MKTIPIDRAKRKELLGKRDQLIFQGRVADEKLRAIPEDDTARRQALRKEIKNLRDALILNRDAYGSLLPRIKFSECPFTGGALIMAFDPVALDGMWWMQSTRVPYDDEQRPGSFRLLRGALNLNQLPPKGGCKDAFVGPGVPYVIPRILRDPSVKMVISQLPLDAGYMAFALAYFSSDSHRSGELSSPWLEKDDYYFSDASGKSRWSIANDAWDFNLSSWIERRRLRWICPGENTLAPESTNPADCPFLDLNGNRFPQVIREDKLIERSLPNPNEELYPFD